MSLPKTLKKCLAEINPDCHWEFVDSAIESRECNVHHVVSECRSYDLAIKEYSAERTSRPSKQQYDALNWYQASMAVPNLVYRVPKVLSYSADDNVLIMEWIYGENLFHYLWKPGFNFQQLSNRLTNTGRWLRRFHQEGKIELKSPQTSSLTDAIDKEMSHICPDTQQLSKNEVFQAGYQKIAVLQKDLFKSNLHQSVAHGDFTPYNVMLHEGSITGVDIWATDRKPVLYDIARMAAYLTIAYPLVNRKAAYNKKGQGQGIMLHFLHGYGADMVKAENPAFKTILLAELLRRWAVINKRPDTVAGKITDGYQLWNLKRNVHRILETF